MLGLQILVLDRQLCSLEIDAVFSRFAHEPIDALMIAGDGFFTSRSGFSLSTLAARYRIPTSYSNRQRWSMSAR